MASEAELIGQLVAAQRALAHDVNPAPFTALDRDAAYRVQIGVMQALGETPGLYKTGNGTAAPIYRSRVGETGKLRLPADVVVGLEVEVGLVLKHDISVEAVLANDAVVADAVDHYFVGVEICGSRFTDRKLAGAFGGLADNVTAFGYCINPAPRANGDAIDGMTVHVEFGGKVAHEAPSKHSFVTVLASLVDYAKQQHPAYPLRAGTVITTGSLCGLVPTSGAGHVRAEFGGHVVELDLI